MNKTLVLVVCLISNVILTCEARIRIGPNILYSKPVKRPWSSVMQNYTIVRPLDEGKGTEHVFLSFKLRIIMLDEISKLFDIYFVTLILNKKNIIGKPVIC